jgi:large subunit ribosomal protein L3
MWALRQSIALRKALNCSSSVRCYSTTIRLLKNDDKKDIPKYQTINNTGFSDEEIEKILQEEEAKMIAEQKARFVESWEPGMRKKPLQSSFKLEEFEYELEPENHLPRWTLLDKRCGALAIKVGMMPVFDEWGVRHPCTVLFMDQNLVVGHKTMEKNGYIAAQIAAGERKRKNVGKSVLGQYQGFLSEEENPPYLVREFRITDESLLPPLHSQIHARHYVPGQNIDVSGISKGKGFQGPMKRHNFGGMPASHGVSLSHRAHGSTGQCQDPGKVFKGKKMAGHMGTERVTTQNVRIIKIDRGRNLLYVLGAVPGNKGHFVEVRDAVKKPLWGTDKVLDAIDRPPLPTFEYEEIDGSGTPHELFMPLPATDPFAPDDEEAA